MRTLIAALTLVTATTLGSTAYAVPAAEPAYDVQSAGWTYVVPTTTALPTCALSSLPSQASDTLDLIHSGGPFPYAQDGTVFQNREGILPDESSGYYHEYTVKTPGSDDRGARRLVGGGAKTTPEFVYYTDDHYSSFCAVDENS